MSSTLPSFVTAALAVIKMSTKLKIDTRVNTGKKGAP